jgi:hypothetical protein
MNTFTNNVDGFLTVAHYTVDDRVRQAAHRSQSRPHAEHGHERPESRRFRLTWRAFRSAPAH